LALSTNVANYRLNDNFNLKTLVKQTSRKANLIYQRSSSGGNRLVKLIRCEKGSGEALICRLNDVYRILHLRYVAKVVILLIAPRIFLSTKKMIGIMAKAVKLIIFIFHTERKPCQHWIM